MRHLIEKHPLRMLERVSVLDVRGFLPYGGHT